MKYQYLLILLVIRCHFIQAQTYTLTQAANAPQAGETEEIWQMDTSAYTAGMPTALSGSAVVWNFSSLGALKHATVSYQNPSGVPASTAFSACNLVQKDDTVLTFIKTVITPSAQTEIVGLDIGLGSINLSNTAIAYKYPFAFGDGFSDNVSGTFDSPFANGTCSGKIITTATATGTLQLPAGKSLPNVLAVKASLTLTLTAFFTTIGTVKRTVFSFYHASEKFPVLNFTYTEVRQLGSNTPTISAGIYGNAFVLVGLAHNNLNSGQNISIFPNPVNDSGVNIVLPTAMQGKFVSILDATGKTLLREPYTPHLNTNNLAPGLYTLCVDTQSGLAYTKLVVKP